eukprot:460313-Amphidinium_carterae.2
MTLQEVDNGIALFKTYATILSGTELTDKEEFNYRSHMGSLLVPCEVLTDSWSLYLAGQPGNSKIARGEKSLLLDKEMVADGLSKSTVPKDALMPMCKTAKVNLSSMKLHSSQAESVSDLQC